MALFYNNTQVSTTQNVYLNSQASNQVFFNNALVWKKETLLWENGNNGVSGGWTTRYMANDGGVWGFSPNLYLTGYKRESHFGALIATSNKINVTAGQTLSFYLSGSGYCNSPTTNVSLWKSSFWVVFLSSIPGNPLPFGDIGSPISTAPRITVWEGLNQHADWTYWWPNNNKTVSYSCPSTGSYHIGLIVHGYCADNHDTLVNSVKLS